MFFTNKKEPRSSINMKGLCTKFGFAAMCEAVCVWVCALLLAFIFLLLATLWWCVCVCVASVVSIPVRSWLEESKTNGASHSDLRPAAEGNTEPSNSANVYETDGFGIWPHNSS